MKCKAVCLLAAWACTTAAPAASGACSSSGFSERRARRREKKINKCCGVFLLTNIDPVSDPECDTGVSPAFCLSLIFTFRRRESAFVHAHLLQAKCTSSHRFLWCSFHLSTDHPLIYNLLIGFNGVGEVVAGLQDVAWLHFKKVTFWVSHTVFPQPLMIIGTVRAEWFCATFWCFLRVRDLHSSHPSCCRCLHSQSPAGSPSVLASDNYHTAPGEKSTNVKGLNFRMARSLLWMPHLEKLLVSVSGFLWAKMRKHLVEKPNAVFDSLKGVLLFSWLLYSRLILRVK